MVEDGSGLSSKDLSNIRSTVLEGREMIENEIKRQLEKYGVYPEERLDRDELSHLNMEDMEIRRKIDAAFEREMSATEDVERSYKNYVKNASFHYLNRLFALKVLEERGFITDTLERKPEFGNRSEMNRVLSEVAGELCKTEDGGLSNTLELAYDELSEEIGVIFEDNDYTAIDLDFKVRNDVIELFEETDSEIWEADETIGWMYQYFGKKEREEIDEKIDEENYKVKDTDIGVKTQLFTPRYIVEWMVDNSLGRLWLEMNPESNINEEDECFYLAPLEESLVDREKKDVKDIKVLDPACGSGHMLFYAFDVLYEMYLEEGEVPEKYIPTEILKNNLYGIDIDPYAVQLAALSLYVKAKSKEPDVGIDQINVVPADAVLVNGEKKDEILSRANELEKKVLEKVWESLENVREFGSLIRIEKKIEEVIEEVMEQFEKSGQSRFEPSEGSIISQTSFITEGGVKKSWEEVKDSILEKVKSVAKEALDHNNPVEEMFAGELEKSVRLVDLFLDDYDVVVTNPPYLDSAKMGSELKKFVKNNYTGSRDLYTAFIERCGEFTKIEGYFSMITIETFIYLHSFQTLRDQLINNFNFVEGTHISNRDTEYMNICFSARKTNQSKFLKTKFNRLVNKKDKVTSLKKITKSFREGKTLNEIYVINQNSFKKIDKKPFIYWFGQEILDLFQREKLSDIAHFQGGVKSGDNDYFFRKWWEVPREKVKRNYEPLLRNGEGYRFYEPIDTLIWWENQGENIIEYADKHGKYCQGLSNTSYYGKEGVTFRALSTNFIARKLPPDTIFTNHSSAIFPHRYDNKFFVGYLNSTLVDYIIRGLNQSAIFNPNYVKKIPLVLSEQNKIEKISRLAEKGIEKQLERMKMYEIYKEEGFKPIEHTRQYNLNLRHILLKEKTINSDIKVIRGIVDKTVFSSADISHDTKSQIFNDLPKNLADYPHITNVGELDTEKYKFRSKVPTKNLSQDECEKLIDEMEKIADKDLREISEELEISPYTVAMAKHKHDLYTKNEKEEAVGRLLSYYLGCIMGRWELEGLEPDDNGIVVFDETFEDNVMDRIRECIELTYGEDEAYEKEREIEDMLGKDIEDWMKNKFFRYHHCKEYRRRGQRIPIYWQLSSDEGTIDCFIYYHKMDKDTFPKLKGQYVDEKIERLENQLRRIEENLKDDSLEESKKKEMRKEREELTKKVDDLEDFAERLEELVREEFEPDFEAGIWENIQRVDELDLLAVPLDKL